MRQSHSHNICLVSSWFKDHFCLALSIRNGAGIKVLSVISTNWTTNGTGTCLITGDNEQIYTIDACCFFFIFFSIDSNNLFGIYICYIIDSIVKLLRFKIVWNLIMDIIKVHKAFVVVIIDTVNVVAGYSWGCIIRGKDFLRIDRKRLWK